MNDLAGDGTTTTIVLAQAMIKSGIRLWKIGQGLEEEKCASKSKRNCILLIKSRVRNM